MNWEVAVVPYQPIRRRRLWRRRLLALCLSVGMAVAYAIVHNQRIAEPMGLRILDDVAITVGLRYYDASYHGVPWRTRVDAYRRLLSVAPGESKRYSLLRRLVGELADSHTAVFSPMQMRRAQNTSDDGVLHWKIGAPGIAYVRLSAFSDNVDQLFRWALEDIGRQPALILDIRGNPGGFVDSIDDVAGIFLQPGTLIATGSRRHDWFGEQRFKATANVGMRYSGRLIVLVDGSTQSGAESLAEALKYYRRAIVVGTRTAGKVLGVDAEERLEDGGLLRVATLDMRAADGTRLEGRGVNPDVTVPKVPDQLRTAMAMLTHPRLSALARHRPNHHS